MNEIVDVPSKPGYGVDSEGNVYARRLLGQKRRVVGGEWRKRKPTLIDRYLRVSIDGKIVTVHRLVAEAFFGPCPPGKEVEHINGQKMDNRRDNVRYVAHRENEFSKRGHGTAPVGERNPRAKLTEVDVREIRRRVEAEAVVVLASEFGVSTTMIRYIRDRKFWRSVA